MENRTFVILAADDEEELLEALQLFLEREHMKRMLKTGIQYLPVDSMQTSWQLYERSQSRIAAICELLVEKDFTL